MHLESSFLDKGQYTTAGILKYEAVFGENFISTGGAKTTAEILPLLGLQPGMRVLDIGCGIGGSAFQMARDYGVHVLGVDLSKNMLTLARQRCQKAGLEHLISFEHGNILDDDRQEVFDVVYSRDAFLHIHDKKRLLQVIRRLLRSGGRLVFTDYLCGARPWSRGFEEYVRQRSYDLRTLEGYESLLMEAGFAGINAKDQTDRFVEILREELATMVSAKLDPGDFRELGQSWRDKIHRAIQGDQRWGLFVAVSP